MKKNNQYVLKNKKRFFSFLFSLFLIVFTLIYTTSVSGYKELEYKAIEIEVGDTLWSIAEKYGQDYDIREYIYHLKKINQIESDTLYAHTTIVIPVKN